MGPAAQARSRHARPPQLPNAAPPQYLEVPLCILGPRLGRGALAGGEPLLQRQAHHARATQVHRRRRAPHRRQPAAGRQIGGTVCTNMWRRNAKAGRQHWRPNRCCESRPPGGMPSYATAKAAPRSPLPVPQHAHERRRPEAPRVGGAPGRGRRRTGRARAAAGAEDVIGLGHVTLVARGVARFSARRFSTHAGRCTAAGWLGHCSRSGCGRSPGSLRASGRRVRCTLRALRVPACASGCKRGATPTCCHSTSASSARAVSRMSGAEPNRCATLRRKRRNCGGAGGGAT